MRWSLRAGALVATSCSMACASGHEDHERASSPSTVASVTIASSAAASASPNASPCDLAARERSRIEALLSAGRLHRVLEVLARADELCPTSASESAEPRRRAEGELESADGRSASALFDAGVIAEKAGNKAEMQRLFDRAIARAERVTGEHVALEPPALKSDQHVLAWSHDQETLAVAVGPSVSLRERGRGFEETRRLAGAASDVSAIAFSPDGKSIAVGTEDGSVRTYARATGAAAVRVTHPRATADTSEPVTSIAFSPDATILLTASSDGGEGGTIRLWDAARGETLRTLEGARAGASPVTFSKDGKLVLAGSFRQGMRAWTVSTGKLAPSPPKPSSVDSDAKAKEIWDAAVAKGGGAPAKGEPVTLSLSPDKKLLAEEDADGVSIVDVGATSLTRFATPRAAAGMRLGLAVSRDGRLLATGSQDHRVRLFTIEGNATMRTLDALDATVAEVAISGDGSLVAYAAGEVRVASTVTGRVLHRLGGMRASSIAFSPDDALLAVGGAETVHLRFVASEGEKKTIDVPKGSSIAHVAFSPDGATLGVSTNDGTLRLFDVASRAEKQHLSGISFAFSPRGHALAFGTEAKIHVWDLAGGREARALAGGPGSVGPLAFSSDGETLAAGADDEVLRTFAWANGEVKETRLGSALGGLAVMPGGRAIAASDASVWLVDRDGHPLARLVAIAGHDAAVALGQLAGSKVALLGPDVDAAAAALRCRVGTLSFPFALCRERFVAEALVSRAAHGDPSFVDP